MPGAPLPAASHLRVLLGVGGAYLGYFVGGQKQQAVLAFGYEERGPASAASSLWRDLSRVELGRRRYDVPPMLAGAFLFWVLPFAQEVVWRRFAGGVSFLLGAGVADAAMRSARPQGGAVTPMSVLNAPARALALAMVHVFDEHVLAVVGAALIAGCLSMLQWALGRDTWLFAGVVASVTESLGLDWVCSTVTTTLHAWVPEESVGGAAKWWDANMTEWAEDGALVVWAAVCAPSVMAVLWTLDHMYHVWRADCWCRELILYCFILPTLIVQMMWIGVWNAVMMPASVAARATLRDVRLVGPLCVVGVLQGLELIGVDYAIRYLDSAFSGPASVIQGWLGAALARARGQVARLSAVLAPTARWVRHAAVACGSWVVRKVSAVLAWVKKAVLWLLRHRLLVAGSLMESLALTSLKGSVTETFCPFASTGGHATSLVLAGRCSIRELSGCHVHLRMVCQVVGVLGGVELMARDLRIDKLDRIVTWPCLQMWTLAARICSAMRVAAVRTYATLRKCAVYSCARARDALVYLCVRFHSCLLKPCTRILRCIGRLTGTYFIRPLVDNVLVPVRTILLRCLQTFGRVAWEHALRPLLTTYWRLPAAGASLAGAGAFALSFAAECDGLISGKLGASPSAACVFAMASVSLVSLAAQILGSVGQGRPGSAWERVRYFGVSLSRSLDLGVVRALSWLLPAAWTRLQWLLRQARGVMRSILGWVRTLSNHISGGIACVAATLASGAKGVVLGIWSNGPLAFVMSLAVLVSLYKTHRGDWVIVTQAQQRNCATAFASAAGLLSRALPTLGEYGARSIAPVLLRFCDSLVRLVVAFAGPAVSSAATGACQLGSQLSDERVAWGVVLRSPQAALAVWLGVAVLGQGSAGSHSGAIAVHMLVVLALVTFARQLLIYGGAAIVLHLCVCTRVRSRERDMLRRSQRRRPFQREEPAGLALLPDAKPALPDKMFNTQCPICLVDFDAGEQVAGLVCGHQYHPECFERWMDAGNLTCPTCRHRPPRATRAGRFAQTVFS